MTGTLRENGHVILEFMISGGGGIEKSQTGFLEYTGFLEFRRKVGGIRLEILRRKVSGKNGKSY